MTAHLTVDEVGTVRLYDDGRLMDTVALSEASGRSVHIPEPEPAPEPVRHHYCCHLLPDGKTWEQETAGTMAIVTACLLALAVPFAAMVVLLTWVVTP